MEMTCTWYAPARTQTCSECTGVQAGMLVNPPRTQWQAATLRQCPIGPESRHGHNQDVGLGAVRMAGRAQAHVSVTIEHIVKVGVRHFREILSKELQMR